MRQPTSLADRWSWWESAVAGEDPPIHEDEPHAGYFAVRKFRYGEWTTGPFLGARIWYAPTEIDPETGELTAPERLLGEVDGKPINPWRKWTWLARRPITEAEYLWLKALSPLLPKKIPRR